MNIRNTALRAPILAVSLTLLISPLTSAIALAEEGIPREAVSYGDLDLSTLKGQAILESRLRGAAYRVCDQGDGRNAVVARDARRCREAAVARGMHEADALVAVAAKAAAAGPTVVCKADPDTVAVAAGGRGPQ